MEREASSNSCSVRTSIVIVFVQKKIFYTTVLHHVLCHMQYVHTISYHFLRTRRMHALSSYERALE